MATTTRAIRTATEVAVPVAAAGGGAGTVAFTAPELLVRMYRLFLPPEALAAVETYTNKAASLDGGVSGDQHQQPAASSILLVAEAA
mgnify:CR=1 FL=1